MKKIILTFLSFFLISNISVFSQGIPSETSVYKDLCSYSAVSYYPGVIEKADYLEKQYPNSVFLNSALIHKAEALNSLKNYDDAKACVLRAAASIQKNSDDYSRAFFVLGLCDYNLGLKKTALNDFHESAGVNKPEDVYRAKSVFWAGKVFNELNEYKKAQKPLESVIADGSVYEKADYDEALFLLIDTYENLREYKKAVSLFEKLTPGDFSEETYSLLQYKIASCYEKNKNPLKAFDIYCSLIESKDGVLAVNALKGAYAVSHRNRIDFNPSQIVQKLDTNTENFTYLLSDFWLRMGIDSYNLQNYIKAKECFSYAKQNATDDTLNIIRIYETKIKVDGCLTQSQAEQFAEELKTIETSVIVSKDISIKDSYYATLSNCYAIAGKWNDALKAFNRVKNPDEHSSYIGAASYYKSGNYEEAEKILKKYDSPKSQLLYANVLARLGKYDESAAVYVALNSKGQLDPKNRFEFAKVLYCQKKWEAAYKHSKTAGQPVSGYLCALCAINLGKWEEAITAFDSYIKNYASAYGYQDESYFYKAFAQYKLGQYQTSYKSFKNYVSRSSSNALLNRRAYSLAAKCAVMLNDYPQAAVYAEELVKISYNEDDKHEAILFCSEIYSDSKNYDKAIKVLSPYLNGKSDFNLTCLYKTAQIYEKSKDYNNADVYYEKTYNAFPKSKEAQDALYRRGELFYLNGEYEKAGERFNQYLMNYPSGKYCDASYYFCAECNLYIKQYNRSIMQNKYLIANYPKSIYIYGAYSNLLKAYYALENYGEALGIARILADEYQDQAESDGTIKRLVELEKITTGTDRRIVEKQSQYEKLGKKSTKKGRIAGTELVKLYSEFGSMKDAYSLANELLPLQKDSDELLYAASNADIIARYNKSEGQNKKAAQMFLKAAELYRLSGKDSDAAASLYSATDSFVLEGMKADARETAKLLIQLYPQTKQAKNVNKLIK
ncbi:MAG: tetratricopeptide repeat protein [Treponema sp.]|nr:tetratricopeptide repeat protein [Treponema sp.]